MSRLVLANNVQVTAALNHFTLRTAGFDCGPHFHSFVGWIKDLEKIL